MIKAESENNQVHIEMDGPTSLLQLEFLSIIDTYLDCIKKNLPIIDKDKMEALKPFALSIVDFVINNYIETNKEPVEQIAIDKRIVDIMMNFRNENQ